MESRLTNGDRTLRNQENTHESIPCAVDPQACGLLSLMIDVAIALETQWAKSIEHIDWIHCPSVRSIQKLK